MSTDKRDQFITYIRTLRERRASEAARNGYTGGAAIVGLVYIAWETIPKLAALLDMPGTFPALALHFSFIYPTILYAFIAIDSAADGNISRSFDYRIKTATRTGGTARYVVAFTAFIVVPLCAFTYALQIGELNRIQLLQLKINCWVWGLLLLGFVVYVAVGLYWKKKYELPRPSSVPITQYGLAKIAMVVFGFASLEIPIGNFLLAVALLKTSGGLASDLSIVALNTSIAILALMIFMRLSGVKSSVDRLDRLERDVVIHDLSESEVLKRLEEDYLGTFFGTWLSEKLDHFRLMSTNASKLADETKNVISSVEQLDPSLVHERRGRLSEHSEKLGAAIKSFTAEYRRLSKWLRAVMRGAEVAKDKTLIEILERYDDEFMRISEQSLKVVENAIRKIDGAKQK